MMGIQAMVTFRMTCDEEDCHESCLSMTEAYKLSPHGTVTPGFDVGLPDGWHCRTSHDDGMTDGIRRRYYCWRCAPGQVAEEPT